MQLGEHSALSRRKRLALCGSERNCSFLLCEDKYELSFAEQALKSPLYPSGFYRKNYEVTRFLLPTSNICKRLFSKVGFTDLKESAHPEGVKAQIFHSMSRVMKDANDVRKLFTQPVAHQ